MKNNLKIIVGAVWALAIILVFINFFNYRQYTGASVFSSLTTSLCSWHGETGKCEGMCGKNMNCSLFPDGRCGCAVKCKDVMPPSDVSCAKIGVCENTGAHCYFDKKIGSCNCDPNCGDVKKINPEADCSIGACPLQVRYSTAFKINMVAFQGCLNAPNNNCVCGYDCIDSNTKNYRGIKYDFIPCEERICPVVEEEKIAECAIFNLTDLSSVMDVPPIYTCGCVPCSGSVIIEVKDGEYKKFPCEERPCPEGTEPCEMGSAPKWDEDGNLIDAGACSCQYSTGFERIKSLANLEDFWKIWKLFEKSQPSCL